MKKTFNFNILKIISLFLISMTIMACSSGSNDDWPKLEADQLWVDLENNSENSETNLESEKERNLPVIPTTPPEVGDKNISLPEIRHQIVMIERDLPIYKDQLSKALLDYQNADMEEKDIFERGLEIEKSRMNDKISTLRYMQYQLTGHKSHSEEYERISNLLNEALSIMAEYSGK